MLQLRPLDALSRQRIAGWKHNASTRFGYTDYDTIAHVLGAEKAALYAQKLGGPAVLETIGLTWAETLPDWIVRLGKRLPLVRGYFYRPGEKIPNTLGGRRADPRETAYIELQKATHKR